MERFDKLPVRSDMLLQVSKPAIGKYLLLKGKTGGAEVTGAGDDLANVIQLSAIQYGVTKVLKFTLDEGIFCPQCRIHVNTTRKCLLALASLKRSGNCSARGLPEGRHRQSWPMCANYHSSVRQTGV